MRTLILLIYALAVASLSAAPAGAGIEAIPAKIDIDTVTCSELLSGSGGRIVSARADCEVRGTASPLRRGGQMVESSTPHIGFRCIVRVAR